MSQASAGDQVTRPVAVRVPVGIVTFSALRSIRLSSPRPSRLSDARSPSRIRVALPISAQALRVPAMPKSASAASGIGVPHCRPRALLAKRNEAFSGSVKSAVPRATTVPSNSSSCSGSRSRTWSSTRRRELSTLALKSPWVTSPRTRASPPIPSTCSWNANGSSTGAAVGSVSRPISSASALARNCHWGRSALTITGPLPAGTAVTRRSLLRRTRVARNAPGARPAIPTSISSRLPRTTRPRRAGVRPGAAGSTAVTTRSLR